jgi:hypothetical protein
MRFKDYRKNTLLFQEFYTKHQLSLAHNYQFYKSYMAYVDLHNYVKLTIISQSPNSFKIRIIQLSDYPIQPDFLGYTSSATEAFQLIHHKLPNSKFYNLTPKQLNKLTLDYIQYPKTHKNYYKGAVKAFTRFVDYHYHSKEARELVMEQLKDHLIQLEIEVLTHPSFV